MLVHTVFAGALPLGFFQTASRYLVRPSEKSEAAACVFRRPLIPFLRKGPTLRPSESGACEVKKRQPCLAADGFAAADWNVRLSSAFRRPHGTQSRGRPFIEAALSDGLDTTADDFQTGRLKTKLHETKLHACGGKTGFKTASKTGGAICAFPFPSSARAAFWRRSVQPSCEGGVRARKVVAAQPKAR